MNIPIELFLGFIGVSIAIALFGFVRNPQIPACLVMGGMFILTMGIATDNIIFNVGENLLDFTNSTLVSDFTIVNNYTPITENATSAGTDTSMNVTSGATARTIRAGGAIARGEGAITEASILVDSNLNTIRLSLSKTGSPTGIATIGVLDANANFFYTCNTLDVSTLTTSQANYIFSCPDEYIIGNGDRIGIKYTGGDASNLVNFFTNTANPFDGSASQAVNYVASWAVESSADHNMAIYYVSNISNAFDTRDTSYWVNAVNNETPLCIDMDLGSMLSVNAIGLQHMNLTRIPDTIRFYTSNDGMNWINRETITPSQLSQDLEIYELSFTYLAQYNRLCVDVYGSANRWQINTLELLLVVPDVAGEQITNYNYEVSESINYEFTELPKTLFALIGVMSMLVGGLMVYKGD